MLTSRGTVTQALSVTAYTVWPPGSTAFSLTRVASSSPAAGPAAA